MPVAHSSVSSPRCPAATRVSSVPLRGLSVEPGVTPGPGRTRQVTSSREEEVGVDRVGCQRRRRRWRRGGGGRPLVVRARGLAAALLPAGSRARPRPLALGFPRAVAPEVLRLPCRSARGRRRRCPATAAPGPRVRDVLGLEPRGPRAIGRRLTVTPAVLASPAVRPTPRLPARASRVLRSVLALAVPGFGSARVRTLSVPVVTRAGPRVIPGRRVASVGGRRRADGKRQTQRRDQPAPAGEADRGCGPLAGDHLSPAPRRPRPRPAPACPA